MVTPTNTPPQELTLSSYAELRGQDLGELTSWAATQPTLQQVGEQQGHPLYRLVDLDVARGGTTTIKDFAAEHDLDERQIKMSWPKWHPALFPPQVGTLKRGRTTLNLYPRLPLEMIRAQIEAGWTLEEFAGHHGLAVKTLRHTWWKRFPDLTPEPVGARDRTSLYRLDDLERLYRACQGLPLDPGGAPADLLTWAQVLEYLSEAAERTPGARRESMERRRAEGMWPVGQVGSDGVERWRRAEVDRVQAELTSRGGRQRG